MHQMEQPDSGTWIGALPGGIALVRRVSAEGRQEVFLDEPGYLRFGQRLPPGRVAVRDGSLVLRGPDAGDLVLRKVTVPVPGALDSWCGWYEGGGRTLLLTQFPEASLGEPMVLVAEDLSVTRAYLLGQDKLMLETGLEFQLTSGGGAFRMRDAATGTVMVSSPRLRERQVTFPAGQAVLSGTIITPAAGGPHPAAVVVHGSAPGQRDFSRLQAGPLLDAGVAVLIYDKQGHGRSGGQSPVTIFDQAEAARAGIALLRSQTDIQAGLVGLAGQSNGMWAVPIAAAADRDVAFIAGIGAPGVSMAESEVHRRTTVLRDAGISEAAAGWRRRPGGLSLRSVPQAGRRLLSSSASASCWP
jgi:uncharacterized protein